jgi:hypothetical protein
MNRTNLNDRLARHLDDAAAATRLRPGSTTGVVRTARRRSARRRQLTAAASVVAIGGVTVVGVQELSSTSGPEITTGDPASQPDAAAPAPAPAEPRPSSGTVEPQLAWRAVQPDSAAAVGNSVGAASRFGSTFPGALVSTSPAGTDEDGLFRLWRSEDGVTFSQTGTSPPIGSLLNGAAIGSHVYAFGTAPGVAATEPNPLLASISDDGGTTWDQVTLPVDTNRLRNLPGVNSVGTQGTVARTEAGTLIAVTTYAGTDLQDLVPGTPLLSFGTNGAEVVVNGECQLSAEVTAPPVVLETEPALGERPDGCVTELRTWEELGVDAELAAAATGGLSTLLHSADGRTFTELASPTGAPVVSLYLPSTTEPIVVTRDGAASRLWRLDPNLTWVELPMPFGDIYTVLQVNNRLTAVHANGDPNERMLAVSTFDGATWQTVNLGALVEGATEVHAIGAGDAGIALAVLVAPTPATANTVPEATTTIVSPVATDAGSEGVAPTGTQVPPTRSGEAPEWYVLHSTDGVDWSVEDLRDLLGPEAIGLPSVQRIGSTGNQLMITVSMSTETGTTPSTQTVLVGTPKG